MKRRTILSSILAIIACIAVISGSTYALFTSESSVNIAITSGKVNVTAAIKDLTLYSATADTTTQGLNTDPSNIAGVIQNGPFAGTYYYQGPLENNTFTNGGKATLSTDTKTLTLDKVTPGDKVKLTVDITNNSNVAIQYRIRVNALDTGINSANSYKLFKGLSVLIGSAATDLNSTIRVSDWTSLAGNTEIGDIPVEIALPLEAGNEYQELTTKIQITVEAVQGNANTSTLAAINAVLTGSTARTNKTMSEAIQEVVAGGTYTYDDLKGYVWSVDNDLFYAEEDVEESFEYRFFKVYDAMPDVQTYSIYADTTWATAEVTGLTVGFDAGETTNITAVNYDRNGATAGRDVVIKTNSATTNITIDAPLDSINRYGVAGIVTINGVAQSSYHENGKAVYIEIAKGRIALELGADVKTIHLVANDAANGFEPIVVSKESTVTMPTFERDPVTIDPNKGTFVVELQSDTNNDENTESDYVWLTAVGVYEQVTLGTAEEAGKEYAVEADSSKAVQKTAAQQIANNISTTIGNDEYSVHATKDAEGGWTYTLKDGDNHDTTFEVTAVVVTTTKTEEKVTSTASVTVTNQTVEQTTINNNSNDTAATKQKAVDDVVEGGVVYNQTKGVYYNSGEGKTYANKHAALSAAIDSASANDSLILLQDVVLTDVLTIEGKTLKIIGDGTGHTITSASNQNITDGRAINIWGDNSNITLKNLTIVGPTGGSLTRGLNIGNENVTVKLENCMVTCSYYAINIIKGHNTLNRGYSNNLNLTIKDSTIRGWAAINHHGSSGNIEIENSTLVGINNNSGISDGFATIVIDGNAINDSNSFVSDNNVTIKNSTIIAQQNGSARQSWISFQYGAVDNNAYVSIDGNTKILDSEEYNAKDKVTAIYMGASGNVIRVILTSEQKEELLDLDYLVTDNSDGTSSITLSEPNIWYSNGQAIYQNNQLGVVDPNSQYQPMNTSFKTPFVKGWLADGEGIKLIGNVSLRKNVTLEMTEGSIYMILGDYTITGTGKIVLQGVASVISDKDNLESLFASENITVTYNSNNGTYTYRINDELNQLYANLIGQNAVINSISLNDNAIFATLSDNVVYYFDCEGKVEVCDASNYNGYYGDPVNYDMSTYYLGRLVPVNYLSQATPFSTNINTLVIEHELLSAYKGLEGNTTIETIEFGEGVTTVPSRLVFDSHVSKVILTNDVTTIKASAFYYNAYIEDLVIPASVTSISQEAFRDMGSLKTLTIKGSPTVDVYYIGRTCNQLTNVYFEGANTIFTNSKGSSQTFTRAETGAASPIVVHFATQAMLETFDDLNSSSTGLSFAVIE